MSGDELYPLLSAAHAHGSKCTHTCAQGLTAAVRLFAYTLTVTLLNNLVVDVRHNFNYSVDFCCNLFKY